MEERSLLITLYLSFMLSLCFMSAGTASEIAYLKSTQLFGVLPSQGGFLHALAFAVMLLFIAVTFAAALGRRARFVALCGCTGALALFQIAMLIFGAVSIGASSHRYEARWESLSGTDSLAAVERALHCCGYVDTIMSASQRCTYDETCGAQIDAEIPYRLLRFVSSAALSLLLQVLCVAALRVLRSDSRASNEFDELLVTA